MFAQFLPKPPKPPFPLPPQSLSFFLQWINPVGHIHLSSYQNRPGSSRPVVLEHPQPTTHVAQTFRTTALVHQECSVGVSEVGRHQTFVLLLTRGVPKLQAKGTVIHCQVAAKEVYAQGGPISCQGTFDDASNSSRTKRSIMKVLPTPVTPSSTSLNLVSQRLVIKSALPVRLTSAITWIIINKVLLQNLTKISSQASLLQHPNAMQLSTRNLELLMIAVKGLMNQTHINCGYQKEFSEIWKQSPLSFKKAASLVGSSVIMPLQPIETALSQSSSSFTIQQKVKMPLFLRCGMNNLPMRLKNLSKVSRMQINTLPQQEVVIPQTASAICLVTRGISSMPYLRDQKGSKPVMHSRNILKPSHPEQKLRTFGEVSLRVQLALSLKAPQTVEQQRLCLRTSLQNSLTAVSVGVFSSMLSSMSGNQAKSVSSRGILFFSVLTAPPPQLWIDSCIAGISANSTSPINLSCPVVLLRLVSWCTTSWPSLVSQTSSSNMWLRGWVRRKSYSVFQGPQNAPPLWLIQSKDCPSASSLSIGRRYRCLARKGKHRQSRERRTQEPGMSRKSSELSINIQFLTRHQFHPITPPAPALTFPPRPPPKPSQRHRRPVLYTSLLQSCLFYSITQFTNHMEEDDYNYEQDYDYSNDYGEGNQGSGQGSGEEEVPSHLINGYSQGRKYDDYDYQPYEILPLQKICLELNVILEEVDSIVYLGKGWSLLLLKQFKWDKEFLKEEYYNNMQKYQKAIGLSQYLSPPASCTLRPASSCDVCLSEPVSILNNICGHSYCLDCWLGHLKGGVTSSNPFLRCMWENCRAPLLLETCQKIFKQCGEEGASWRKKYEKKLCQLFITTNRNYQFCTGADCGNCIKINELTVDAVECVCGKVFCFRCQSDDHYPCKCQQKEKWQQKVLSQEADAKWIATNAKVCPWCKKAVQRSMGCNFMSCTCGKSFCYMCSQPWQPDHKDHFKCHLFKKRPDQVLNRQKEIMERMNHCTQRYLFNQAVANNYKQTDVFSKRKYLFKALNVELVETEFLETAYKFAIECCERLKWIYAFTYFNEFTQKKEAFEFSLGEYEKYKENLLKMLAADLKMFITSVEQAEAKKALTHQLIAAFQDNFKVLKKSIVNYYTCTKSFKEKFVDELQRITEKLDQEKERQEMKSYQPPDIIKQKSISGGIAAEEQKKGGILDSILSLGRKGKKNKK